jgi:hypothetical protein
MNELIERLADQCYYINTSTDMEMFDKEKFAQLLVKACGDFTDPVTRNLMMKHFGVEL